MIPRWCSKFFKVGFSRTWIKNFLMYKLSWEKAKAPEIKLLTFVGSWRKQSSSREHLFCFFDCTKVLTVWITTNCGKFLKGWEYQNTLPVSWETCLWVKKQQSEWVMEQQTGSKLENDYLKAGYGHPVYLTYIWSASCEWQAEIKISVRNINKLRNAYDAILKAESEEEL